VTTSHVKIGFLALCLALLLGVPALWISSGDEVPQAETNVAVEHDGPASMRVARLEGSGTNVFEIGFAGSGSFAIHLPSSWKRQEVRGVPLASMVGEPREWGYVRWTMPAGAVARFDAPDPGRLTLHNPSGIPLAVTVTTVRGGGRDDEAAIVTDEPYILP
jgi:hypothetical protein